MVAFDQRKTSTKLAGIRSWSELSDAEWDRFIEELKQLRKQQTKSLPNIRYVNKNFIPTISFYLDKRSNTYGCVIKIKGTSKSFYLGKEDKIKKEIMDKLNEDWSDYSINKLKFSLRNIIETVIMDFIDVKDISSL